jgi:UDP:flavonoid glycosyltransferase YjiC (YdhE family)
VSGRRRVLFVSEAVTLAQVVRLVVLARSLDPRRYQVHFASARFDELIFAGTPFVRWPIWSPSPEVVERRVRGGRRVFTLRGLRRSLADDRRVLDAVRPELVVGDLRLSLAVAAPLAGVPYAALINAYWSPHAVRQAMPLPDHPIVRLLGPRLAARYFPAALPRVFAHFAAPLNRLRREHGLAEVGDLPRALTHGDVTLFPDVPELVPTEGSPHGHRYLGPLLWSPRLPLPPWWQRLDPGRPTIYLTLGSSGRAELLPMVARALSGLGAQLLVATAGRVRLEPLPHTHVADFLPGDQAAARADLVVCNGGSSTGYQALAAGKPVVGIASNLDQYLAMTAIADAGAGLLVRAGTATLQTVRTALATALATPTFARAAARLAHDLCHWNAPATFTSLLRSPEFFSASGPAPGASKRTATKLG